MAKILLADDSTHAQRMGAKILAAEGYEVITVSNGQAAIHSIEQSVPDLVVADVFMPGRNGYEVCQFVKSDSKLSHIPVLLIIGAMEPYDPEEGKRVGTDGLITKPLESSNLVARVQDLLSAAKRFAPTRAKLAKEPAEVSPQEEIAEEPPAWAEEAEEIPSTRPEKLEIPHEVGQQAVSMFTDLLAGGETSEAPPMAAVEPPPMASLEAPPIEMALPSESSVAEAPEVEPVPQAPPLPSTAIEEQTVWTAESAAITPEEEKLFDQPAANWGDLAHLVEESGQEVPSPQSVPAEAPPVPPWMPAAPAAIEETPVQEAPSPSESASAFSPPGLAWPSPAEEPKPEPVPAPPAVVDPATLEHIVRGVVGELMPQIIERVRQSLKT